MLNSKNKKINAKLLNILKEKIVVIPQLFNFSLMREQSVEKIHTLLKL